MGIQTLNIPIEGSFIIEGDTIDEILFTFDDTDDIDLIGATIKMQIYRSGVALLNLSTGSGITILTSKSFKIDEIPKESNNLPEGKFLGDLEITLADGTRNTYFRVSYKVDKQYTV
jgi:hypothetical protein